MKVTGKHVMAYLFKELACLDKELYEAERTIEARKAMLGYHKGHIELLREALRNLGLKDIDIDREMARRQK